MIPLRTGSPDAIRITSLHFGPAHEALTDGSIGACAHPPTRSRPRVCHGIGEATQAARVDGRDRVPSSLDALGWASLAGRKITNVDPFPVRLRTAIAPPSKATSFRE